MNSLRKLSTIVVFVLVLSTVSPNRQQEVQGNGTTGNQVRALEYDVRAFGAYAKEDLRPAVVLHNVSGANFFNVDAQRSKGASLFQLQSVIDFNASHCKGVKDTKLERVERIKL